MDYTKREIPVCDVCQEPANQTCGGCRLVYYCSKEHQKIGWREGHKSKCRSFKIQYSDTLGRHMVATRDIKQGEMIIREKPAVLGPKMACTPQCLTCGKKLHPLQTPTELDFYKCTMCNWPMCDLICEKSQIHEAECKLMTRMKYKCHVKYERPDKVEAAYCIIAPLRVLLLKESNRRQYENIINLESHLEDRRHTPLYLVLKANLVTFIIQVLELPFDEETILKVASIFDTNSFDVRSPDGSMKMRAVYVTVSMMNHSCKPNTRHIYLGDDNNLALIATVPIAKGEMITATYTQTLWSTLDRRKHIRTNKCFECECERCVDPTELGTYLGNIYCSICNGPFTDRGLFKGAMLVSMDPLDETAPWKCQKCNHVIQGRQMLWGNDSLKQELKSINKSSPKGFEEFIDKYIETLHPANHLVIQAKLALMQIYGNYKGYMLTELPDHLIKRKIVICYELLEVAERLEPGWSKFRGTILLELQSALTIQTKKEFEMEKLTKESAQDRLMQCMEYLQEAANILRVETHMKDVLENRIQELTGLLDCTSGQKKEQSK